MTLVLLHLLHVLNLQTPATVRLPPPYRYTISDLRIHASDTACLDVFLIRLNKPIGTIGAKDGRRWLLASNCFRDGDWDTPEGADYHFKRWAWKYELRGSDYVQLEFVARQPTRDELQQLWKVSGEVSTMWLVPPTSATVIVSGWMERVRP